MSPRPPDPVTINKILNLWKRYPQLTTTLIAERFGVGPPWVRDILRQAREAGDPRAARVPLGHKGPQ